MLHIVLFQPQIPQNTGNIGRMCAVTRSRLHLIHPLGFEVSDKNLKRAGMDYWYSLDVHHHSDWAAFKSSHVAPKRLWLFTTHATRSFWAPRYEEEDGLVFGNEESGAPEWLHAELGDPHRVKIPHANAELRSLNLSTSAGIAAYEAIAANWEFEHLATAGPQSRGTRVENWNEMGDVGLVPASLRRWTLLEMYSLPFSASRSVVELTPALSQNFDHP